MFNWFKKAEQEIVKVESYLDDDYSEIISAIKSKYKAVLINSENEVAELKAKIKAIETLLGGVVKEDVKVVEPVIIPIVEEVKPVIEEISEVSTAPNVIIC